MEPSLSSYLTVSAGARARWKGLTGFLTITNLANNEYETYGTFAPNARATGAPIERFVTPAAPIHFDAGLTYRF